MEAHAYKKHIDNFTNLLININDLNDPLNKLSPFYFKKIKDLNNFRSKLQLLNKINDKNYKLWLNRIDAIKLNAHTAPNKA